MLLTQDNSHVRMAYVGQPVLISFQSLESVNEKNFLLDLYSSE